MIDKLSINGYHYAEADKMVCDKINEIIDVVNRLEEHKHNIIKWHIDKVSDGCMAKLVTSTPITETSEPIKNNKKIIQGSYEGNKLYFSKMSNPEDYPESMDILAVIKECYELAKHPIVDHAEEACDDIAEKLKPYVGE